ncbi:GerAB/ArcD/ProY family transporter [Robertmurraya korlensis]|uniref:GerAB/ArcD/ProY family transporter n=1 Tax=Robertmurraya korlensis TaxID=519977 RepID=UPI000824F72B|nr:GerAB/ArcD/ProY family transporter [Robertmurraya korlensis]
MTRIPERLKVSPFFAFYLVQAIQIGVGILGFQRLLTKAAGNDAWISILFAGIGVHVIIWMTYKILDKQEGDITDVHKILFGKWIGAALSLLLIMYLSLLSITILRTYIEVVQVWIFPGIRISLFSASILIIVFYVVNGGLRTVTGMAVLGVILPAYLLFSLFYPLKYSFFENLLPIFDHSILEILQSTKQVTLSILGFETLLFYYPFLKEARKSQKWAHLGSASTIFVYLAVMVVSTAYFSEEQLMRNIWATLTMLKIVELPFVERVEYVAISSWLFVILPNICLAIWAASRGLKRILNKKQRPMVVLLLIFVCVVSCTLRTREQVDMLNNYTAQIGFFLIYGYIPFLFLFSTVYYRIKGRKST